MSWLMAAVYDRFMCGSEEACLAQWRAELLRELSGEVLEVGAGTGVTLPHYPKSVTRLTLCEPDAHMRRKLKTKADSSGLRNIEISGASLESLRYDAASFDAVVCSLVLCSVPDQAAALAEIRRVLKPAGRLAFLEHVAADGKPRRLLWQRRIEPVWKHLMGNCHLTRRTESAIAAAGFRFERIQRESIRKALPIVRPSIRGIARKL
ncbi:MAG TPA: class I SAM-dependent methyltransferase [Burkholderiales bacterium]|nr:class I SAM-dependent methyltransferase [Burkholderiales bacterium]